MISVRFNLKNPTAEKSSVVVYASFDGNRIKLSSGISINSKNWNSRTQRVSSSENFAKALNNKLDSIDNKIKEIYYDNFKNGPVDAQKFEKLVKQVIAGKELKNESKIGFLEHYNAWWQETSSTRRVILRSNKLGYNKMFEYLHGEDLSFEEINYQFYVNYTQWLTKQNYSLNYIAQHQKLLKAVMNDAYKKELHNNRSFMNFSKNTETTTKIYLTREEIEKIHTIELSTLREDQARDLFLVGCYTGLRYSDVRRVTANDIRDNKLHLRTTKTGEYVIIPISSIFKCFCARVLQKY